MKNISLHIAFAALLSLLSLASCSRNDEVTVADGEEGKVYVTLTLSINGEEAESRATWENNDYPEDGNEWENTINDLQILIYDATTNAYVGRVENLIQLLDDRYSGTLSAAAWKTNKDYKVMAFANCPTINNPNNIGNLLYTRTDVEYIPMWGVTTTTLNLIPGESDDIGGIDLLRAMAKVEVNFSEDFPTDEYTIGDIIVSPYNTKGYCVPKGYASVDNTGDLDREEAGTAYSFNPYLSESKSALTFKKEDGKYYIYLPEYKNTETNAATIQVTVNGETYPLEFKNYENGTPTGAPYDIVRNHIYRYTITGVNNGELTVKYRALPWDLVGSEIGYTPESASTTVNPFGDDTEYAKFMKNGYILLPVAEFKNSNINDKVPDEYNDRTTVRKLFKFLYDYPGDYGDDDARYCILTKPTYVDADRKILKTGTAGARYFFMLTGPKGATWEAHLSNHEDEGGDFTFSDSKSNDFKNCQDAGYTGEVKMVSHGIARPKPYIIQVNCVRSWTGTDETAATDENDKVTGEYPWYEKEGNDYWDDENNESRVDDIDKWSEDERNKFYKDYDEKLQDAFTYYTAWGKDNNTNERVIATKLYITVTLADGTKYNLNINPSYKDHPNKDKMDFLYQDYRRYAGEKDDYVWIRQVPAQFGWSFEELARDADEGETGTETWDNYQWWRENPYWKK